MEIRFTESVTAKNSERYNLYMRIWPGNFAVAGFIPDEKDSFFYETTSLDPDISYIDALKNIFFENECMRYVYKSLTVICVTEKYTIVPEEVHNEKGKKELFAFCFGSTENFKIITQHVENQSYVILFGLDSEIYEFLVRSFVNVNFVHVLSPLLKVWQQNSLESYPKHVYVYVRNEVIDIVSFERGELIFSNTFPYEKENDILYFVTCACKQTGFNQLDDRLIFCGEASVCNSAVQALSAYFENISLFSGKMEKYIMALDQDIPVDIITLTE